MVDLNAFGQGYNQGLGMVTGLRRQSALAGYKANPQASIDELRMVDPDMAKSLMDEQNQARMMQRRKDALRATSSGEYGQAREIAIEDGDNDLFDMVTKMDEGQKAQAMQEANQAKQKLAALRGLPMDQRQQYAAQMGLGPESVSDIELDQALVDLLGLEGALKQRNEERRLGVQEGGLGVRQGQLGVQQQRVGASVANTQSMIAKRQSSGGGRGRSGGGVAKLPTGFILE
jgi:hypothetical protein